MPIKIPQKSIGKAGLAPTFTPNKITHTICKIIGTNNIIQYKIANTSGNLGCLPKCKIKNSTPKETES